MRAPATVPITLQIVAEASRGPRSKIVVTIDRGVNGGRFVTVARQMFGKQGKWIVPRSVSLQRSELQPIARALLRAAALFETAQ